MGYYNHFEIGWVLREYTQLINEANKCGIESSGTYYNDGKTKGGLYRGQIIDGQKTLENKANKSSDAIYAKLDIKKIKAGSNLYSPDEMPRLCDFSSMIWKSRVTELPSFLDGFRFLRKN